MALKSKFSYIHTINLLIHFLFLVLDLGRPEFGRGDSFRGVYLACFLEVASFSLAR